MKARTTSSASAYPRGTADMIDLTLMYGEAAGHGKPVSVSADEIAAVGETGCGHALIHLRGGNLWSDYVADTGIPGYRLDGRKHLGAPDCGLSWANEARVQAGTALVVAESRASVVAKINAARAAARITVIRTEGGAA